MLKSHEGGISALAFAPDGRLITGSADNTARVWDMKSPAAPRLVFRGHEGAITALAFAPDGRLATGSDDTTARVWDLKNPTEPLVLRGHKAMVDHLAFTSDGRLVTASLDGTARVWDLDPDHLIKMARETAGRNLSEVEWQQFMAQELFRRTFPDLPLGPAVPESGLGFPWPERSGVPIAAPEPPEIPSGGPPVPLPVPPQLPPPVPPQ